MESAAGPCHNSSQQQRRGGGEGALGLAPGVAERLKTPIRRPSSPPKETASLEVEHEQEP